MIPAFKENILPPYIGFPTSSTQMSPYWTNMPDFASRFGNTRERLDIMSGLLDYRARLYAYGITGFQWLSGSFVENVEVIRGRPPGDIDVVSVVNRPPGYESDDKWVELTAGEVGELLFESQLMKARFHCDAQIIDMNEPSEYIVDSTRFWFGLFTHQKVTDGWKGIAAVELDEQQDTVARGIIAQALATLTP